jgi:mitochondrial chaperone BCS1
MAGELGLDVYIISLSRAGLDDTALSELISELPEKCIALMEDIDAAFHHGLNRDLPVPKGTGDNSTPNHESKPPPPTSRITLSGLLNALDGVGAQEGRILYATTNKYTSLDPALCRPGRMDLHVQFKLASQYQAGELYKCFYMPSGEVEKADKDIDKDKDHADEKAENESVDSGYGSVRGETDDTPASENASPSTTPPLSPTPILALSPIPSSSPSAVPSPTATPPPYQTVWMGSSHRARAPALGVVQVASLAAKFATMIPEREFSMASLQGYLMMYKTRPFDAVRDASGWVEKERRERVEKAKADVKEVKPEAAKVDPVPTPAVVVAEAAKVNATPPVVALKVADAPAEPAKDVSAAVPATTEPDKAVAVPAP